MKQDIFQHLSVYQIIKLSNVTSVKSWNCEEIIHTDEIIKALTHQDQDLTDVIMNHKVTLQTH